MGGQDGTNVESIKTDSTGRQEVIGAASDGSAVAGNPVLVAGQDGTNAQSLSTDSSGQIETAHDANSNPIFAQLTDGSDELDIATDGSAAKTKGVQVMGTDGTNAQTLSTDSGGQIQTAHDANSNPAFITITDGTTDAAVDSTTGALDTNIDGFGGTAVDLGQEGMASSMPVAIASDQSAVPVTPGGGDAHDETFDTNPLGIGLEYESPGSLNTVDTAGDISRAKGDAEGRIMVAPWTDTVTTSLQFSGDDTTGDNKVPDTDTATDVRGAKDGVASIEFTTPTVAAGPATFDLDVLGSADGGTTYNDVGSPLVTPFTAQAEGVTDVKLVNVAGLTHIKIRFDINTAAPTTGEDITCSVNVNK
jgi:hypothetical protein